jgi:hypothetical protein
MLAELPGVEGCSLGMLACLSMATSRSDYVMDIVHVKDRGGESCVVLDV